MPLPASVPSPSRTPLRLYRYDGQYLEWANYAVPTVVATVNLEIDQNAGSTVQIVTGNGKTGPTYLDIVLTLDLAEAEALLTFGAPLDMVRLERGASHLQLLAAWVEGRIEVLSELKRSVILRCAPRMPSEARVFAL
mgnify:CR=1 FL=1